MYMNSVWGVSPTSSQMRQLTRAFYIYLIFPNLGRPEPTSSQFQHHSSSPSAPGFRTAPTVGIKRAWESQNHWFAELQPRLPLCAHLLSASLWYGTRNWLQHLQRMARPGAAAPGAAAAASCGPPHQRWEQRQRGEGPGEAGREAENPRAGAESLIVRDTCYPATLSWAYILSVQALCQALPCALHHLGNNTSLLS